MTVQRSSRTHGPYRDRHTGRSLDRPALGRLERDIIAGKVGTVVVWRNDRMGRRARQLLVFLEDLDERKIDYISVRDGHLTGDSASAKIFRHMSGSHCVSISLESSWRVGRFALSGCVQNRMRRPHAVCSPPGRVLTVPSPAEGSSNVARL